MQQRKGRPPIDIEDLQPEEEPEEDPRPKKGSLSYSGGGAPPRRGRSQKIDNGGNMAQALMAAIAAIAISVFVSFNMFVPKTDIQAMTDKVNQAAASASTSATQAVSSIQSQVSNIIVNYATKADLANYATKAEITGLKAPDLSTYYTKAEIDALLLKKANVGSGSGGTTTTTPTGDLTVGFYGSPISVYNPATYEFPVEIINGSDSSYTIRLKIEMAPESSKPNLSVGAFTKFSIDSSDVNKTTGDDRIDTIIYPSSGLACYALEGSSGEIWIPKKPKDKDSYRKLVTIKLVLAYSGGQSSIGWDEPTITYKVKN